MTQLSAGSIRDKIVSLEQLAETAASLRAENKKVVHCHGVFDLLHIGHIRHFELARRMGDALIVTVTPDRYVDKGPHHPAFTESLRAEAIASLACVDYVAINNWPTAVETIGLLKPCIYVKGSDYKDASKDHTGKIMDEEAAVQAAGGEIAFTEDIMFSSSKLINRNLQVLPDEVRDYLDGFTRRYTVDDILGYFRDASSLNVLVIGEAIIDDYRYCETIGKSAKEPILAAKFLNMEKYAGGTLAVANHVANFCDNVTLLTILGERDTQEEFVRQSLRDNIETMFIYKADSPTIVKRRFVESYLLQKLFEVYEMNDEELNGEQEHSLCALIEKTLPSYDVVIAVDYGHGMLTGNVITTLCRDARFLAVNTQANAGNRGFNTISKYPRADYICLANHEIALEERSRQGNVREMMLNISRKLTCDKVVVTRGRFGNTCYSEAGGFVEAPAFTEHVIDRMGAGDAVISLTSLCVARQAPMEVVGFISNVVGAQAVATLGHKKSIERASLFKYIESLMK